MDRLGPATDIYGLGATLYCLLTGRAPVDVGDLLEVITRVGKGDIPTPRSVDPTIARPLEAICRKAMALEPADRYPSARALAEDVTQWLDDAPVSAYQEPAVGPCRTMDSTTSEARVQRGRGRFGRIDRDVDRLLARDGDQP